MFADKVHKGRNVHRRSLAVKIQVAVDRRLHIHDSQLRDLTLQSTLTHGYLVPVSFTWSVSCVALLCILSYRLVQRLESSVGAYMLLAIDKQLPSSSLHLLFSPDPGLTSATRRGCFSSRQHMSTQSGCGSFACREYCCRYKMCPHHLFADPQRSMLAQSPIYA